MNVRLFEVFTSIEGEGVLYGTKTLFVRLAGCPFSCFYCDTLDAIPMDSGTEYSIHQACQIIDEKLQNNTYKVNFTGGEPLLQYKQVAELAKHVRQKKIPTYLESSCFDSNRFSYLLPFIDYPKIEFKTEDSELVDSEHYPALLRNAFECLRLAALSKKRPYVKIVVSSRTEPNKFADLVNQIFCTVNKSDLLGFVIQPTYGISEPNLDLLMALYDKVFPAYSEVRIVPQLHKFIDAP